MSETHMEQQKIDLDALEAALEKATPGEWKWSISSKRVQVAAVRHAAQVCAVWNTSAHPASAVAHAIVSAHNALPALIAELRQLRAREAHMRRFAESMAEDGHPILMGFAYQVQVILDTHALPLPPAPEAQ